MRVLIYGGRKFANFSSLDRGSPDWLAKRAQHKGGMAFLNKLALDWPKLTDGKDQGNWLPDVTVISGGAKGADSLGEDWAVVNWTPLEIFPADWDTHKKAAGFIRNQQMLDSGIDLAVEFPGGNGTADMRRRLDKAGVKVVEYHEE